MGGDNERPQRMEARLNAIENMLKEIKEQMGNVTRKISKVEGSVSEQVNKIEGIENVCRECINIREEMNVVKAENNNLKKKVKEMEVQMENQLIKEKRRDVEIYGIQREENENCKQIVKSLAKAVKVNIEDDEIERCYRPKDFDNRQKPITVTFKSAEIRDKILVEAKKARLRVGQIGKVPENKKIYVNESLIPSRKKLLFKTRAEAKEKNWVAVWTYRGAIFIKRSERENRIKIESEEDLVILIT